ncbi:hypothetical protein BDB00DRAFT_868458 [Zychaea mexicana]|uniref:uncharacterized protein n=1 Tax=Zychaea mexicana TaxID=64656 RepID=UPI0022FE9695|nr:uncharacterized protein BDB00DRAFT_868458 [Zychaea mexicana]KAI9497420.1 hypothetical protein BDB00DRAFT_868458 [Zychaea mexicana]
MDDETTARENHNAHYCIWFRSGFMVDGAKIDMTTTMLDSQVSLSLYITAAVLAYASYSFWDIPNALVHPEQP